MKHGLSHALHIGSGLDHKSNAMDAKTIGNKSAIINLDEAITALEIDSIKHYAHLYSTTPTTWVSTGGAVLTIAQTESINSGFTVGASSVQATLDGIYKIGFTVSYSADTASVQTSVGLAKNGASQYLHTVERETSTAGATFECSNIGLINLTVGDTIAIYYSQPAGVTSEFNYVSLWAQRIGSA